MSISNELSSDLATALLDSLKDEVEADPRDLAEIVLNFHTALRPLELKAQQRRARSHLYGRGASENTPSRLTSDS
jgi:hypothetical protein